MFISQGSVPYNIKHSFFFVNAFEKSFLVSINVIPCIHTNVVVFNKIFRSVKRRLLNLGRGYFSSIFSVLKDDLKKILLKGEYYQKFRQHLTR